MRPLPVAPQQGRALSAGPDPQPALSTPSEPWSHRAVLPPLPWGLSAGEMLGLSLCNREQVSLAVCGERVSLPVQRDGLILAGDLLLDLTPLDS